jgi:hypothetical protein
LISKRIRLAHRLQHEQLTHPPKIRQNVKNQG